MSWVVDHDDPYDLKGWALFEIEIASRKASEKRRKEFEREHRLGPGDIATMILAAIMAESIKQAHLRQVQMQQIKNDCTIQICVPICCYITYVYIRRIFRRPLEHPPYIEQYVVPITMLCYLVFLLVCSIHALGYRISIVY